MQKCVKISVLMPVFNGEKYIAEAVDSILNQTFTDFEFIIVNDGSTDASPDILAGYNDKRIKLVMLKHEGLVYCLNKGLELSEGKYIARMDADDIACPERLQVQYDFMESHPEIGICGSSIEYFFTADSNKRGVIKYPNGNGIRAMMFVQTAFCHPAIMMRKEVLVKSGLRYQEDFFGAEDYRLWIDLLDYTQGANISQVYLYYRRHETNVTVISDKDMEKKIALISKIHYLYMQKHGVNISQEECRIFTHLTDCAYSFDFTGEKGKQLKYILVKIFSQIPTEKNLNKDVKQRVSKILVYRAIKQKSSGFGYCLKSSFYRRMFFMGIQEYIKEKILN